jgi:hypothetical protein
MITAIFIILKLLGYIGFSWWWILATLVLDRLILRRGKK